MMSRKYTIIIGTSKFSDNAFPRISSWMAYVQGFKLNLLLTSCVKYLQNTYTICTMYIRIYTKIYCIQTSCDSLHPLIIHTNIDTSYRIVITIRSTKRII